MTDGDADEVAIYEYDSFGNVLTEAEVSGVDNPYRYSTKEWDENSGPSDDHVTRPDAGHHTALLAPVECCEDITPGSTTAGRTPYQPRALAPGGSTYPARYE